MSQQLGLYDGRNAFQVHLIDFGDDPADSGSQGDAVGPVDVELSQSSSPESPPRSHRATTSPPGRRPHPRPRSRRTATSPPGRHGAAALDGADSPASSVGLLAPADATSSDGVLLHLEGPPTMPAAAAPPPPPAHRSAGPTRSETSPQLARSASASTTTLRDDSRPGANTRLFDLLRALY